MLRQPQRCWMHRGLSCVHLSAPAVSHIVSAYARHGEPAPVVEYISPALAVSHVVLAAAVPAAPAPVVTYISPTQAISYAPPASRGVRFSSFRRVCRINVCGGVHRSRASGYPRHASACSGRTISSRGVQNSSARGRCAAPMPVQFAMPVQRASPHCGCTRLTFQMLLRVGLPRPRWTC